MKTIYNKIGILICPLFIFPFLGGGVLSAQSDDLLNEFWTFIEGNINGQAIQSPANFENGFSSPPQQTSYFLFEYFQNDLSCHEFTVTYFNVSNNQFYLDEIIDIQPNNCQGANVLDFIDKHNSFFVHLPIDTNGTPKNPFNYTIVNLGSQHELTITNSEGDWAKYGGGMLSNSSFNKINFAIYPNPVIDILQVSNSSNQPINATIYAMNGKQLQNHSLDNALSTIHVKSLKPGLYFVVFESETGERVSKKFIKR